MERKLELVIFDARMTSIVLSPFHTLFVLPLILSDIHQTDFFFKEIIENSISQLGLDDDADEEEQETRSHPYVDDNASWTVPVPGTPQRDAADSSSMIQDIVCVSFCNALF